MDALSKSQPCHAKSILNLKKWSERGPGVPTILASKSLSRHSVVQIWRISTSKSALTPPAFRFWLPNLSLAAGWCKFWRHLRQPTLRTRPFLGADFASLRSHKMEWKNISCNSYPPKPHVTHLSCITSAQSHLLVNRSSAATLSIVGS